ncbi:type II toxin-antitoxin system RelE/ParE family toxin [Janthinobacterium sp. SUN211]|uniref:type II toxin-antitoxin system RelE/ParE family toxin n=1 Tax=Janthinobacterium sp. SUN211 TaxID=3014786 RepID=UPI00271426BE|nr:type II toxin-antitoxin system RelE/ParE family toxin [Janthinobacterium sp. SUN211]MDO8051976.1 type II toxin-antitoxin system RelE/ParE family toxin [Janthinobacterium sp. SUN211]
MAEYRLTPAAEQDLEAIWEYTSQRWGVQQASHYLDSMTAAFGDLARAPEAAPGCEQIRPGYRRRKVGKHMIYFRVTPYGIAIVRILHDRMDPARHLS